MAIYSEALAEFKQEHPDFIGSKIIYSPSKFRNSAVTEHCFETIKRLKAKYPDFLVGFDLVGQEDPSPPLVSYAEHILKLPSDINFYFHAGETNWFGGIDENMVNTLIIPTIHETIRNL